MSTVNQLAVQEYIFVHQDHSAKSNDQTLGDYYLFWNLKSDDCIVRYLQLEWLETFSLMLQIISI